MYLGNRKAKTKGYEHYLGSQNLPVPEKDISQIVQDYRDGNSHLRDFLVNNHMRLAMDIVGRYHGKGYQDVDELVSVAMLAVVDAVDKAAERLHDNNITGYVVSNIHYAIYQHLAEDSTIRVPKRSQERGHSVKVSSLEQEPPQSDLRNRLIYDEMKERMCKTRSDREVLDLTEKGYNDVEIAKLLQVPRLTIYKIKMKMKGRLDGY